MTRRRFSERQIIETLIRQGAVIKSYRSKAPITLENVNRVEREHILEIALGGEDTPANCAYSLSEEHAVVTNGTKATTAGSSKQRVAKVKRLEKARQILLNAPGPSKRGVNASGEPCLRDVADGNLSKMLSGYRRPASEPGEVGERQRREGHSQQGAGADDPFPDGRETRLPPVKHSRWPRRKMQSGPFPTRGLK